MQLASFAMACLVCITGAVHCSEHEQQLKRVVNKVYYRNSSDITWFHQATARTIVLNSDNVDRSIGSHKETYVQKSGDIFASESSVGCRKQGLLKCSFRP